MLPSSSPNPGPEPDPLTLALNLNLDLNLTPQGLCEKRVEAAISLQTVAFVIRKATEEKFLFLKRQSLHYALDHYGMVRGRR